MSVALDTDAGTKLYLKALNKTTGIFASGDFTANLPMSASCWVKKDATGWNSVSDACFGCSQGTSASGTWYQVMANKGTSEANGRAQNYVRAGGAEMQLNSPVVVDANIVDTWVLCVAVWTSTSDRDIYFIDSTTVSSETATTVSPASCDSLILGMAREASTNTGIMDLAELAFWGVALTASDVADLETKKPSEVQAANLVHYWPLVDDRVDSQGVFDLVDGSGTPPTFTAANHPSLTGGGGGASGQLLSQIGAQGMNTLSGGFRK